MGSFTTQETMRSGAQIYVGAAGAAVGGAFVPIGYTTDKVSVKIETEKYDVSVGQYAGPILRDQEVVGATISGSTIQVGAEQLCAALGITQTDQTITLGGSAPNAVRQFAVKLVGVSQRSGTAMTVYLPYAMSDADVSFDLTRKEFTAIPLSFRGMDGPSGIGQILFGSAAGNVTKTISSGAIMRDAAVNFYLVAGEGGAADALDTINGTFANNEEVVLQISSAAQPITLTHTPTGTGKIVLDGAVPWVMTSLNDWIKLRSDGTKFTEVARYNA